MGKGERNDNIRLAMSRSAIDARILAEARHLADRWNDTLARKEAQQFSPTLGCAINAGYPWLRLHCPGCRQLYEIDLRRIVRPRDYPITALKLSCESVCRGAAPKPELLGLFAWPEQHKNAGSR